MARKPHDFKEHPQPFIPGSFRGICKHVTDGDTIDVFVDLGFLQYHYLTIRVRGIDTPEIRGEEKPEGLRAKALVMELLLDQPIILKPHRDKTTFGRYEAQVFHFVDGTPKDIVDTLEEAGFPKSEAPK